VKAGVTSGARERIRAVVDSIPRGCVATYGLVAREAGLPRRARLVGRVLAELPAGSRIPWHRVVNASGATSTDRLPDMPPGLQRALLEAEGVAFRRNGTIELEQYRWLPNTPRRPRPRRTTRRT